MYFLRTLFVFGFLVLLISCKKDPPSSPAASPLMGCCETPATNATFGNASVYIPNIFTPNQDGINDLFVVLGDSVKTILHLEVKNLSNQTVYSIDSIPYDVYRDWLHNNYYWDGYSNSELVPGIYSYATTLEAENGTIISYEGKVCNYPCDLLEDEEKITMTGCQFPSQSLYGQYDPNISTGEGPCFK